LNQKNTVHLCEALYFFRYQNGRHDLLCCSFFEFSARRHPFVLIYHTVISSRYYVNFNQATGIISKNIVMYFMLFKFNPPKSNFRLHESPLNCPCDTVVSMQSLLCRLPHNTQRHIRLYIYAGKAFEEELFVWE
jgi:hypothetical protein